MPRPFAVALALMVFALAPMAGADCGDNRGDVSPGTLDESVDPPAFRAAPDGSVAIGDVVAILREVVDLQRIAWTAPSATCPPPGDLAPGRLDTSTVPPSWIPHGDGRLDLGDAIAALRASIGLQQVDDRLTYFRDTRRIINDRCAGCHLAGGVGPFALTTWAEVEPEVGAIAGAVAALEMPPWPPSAACSAYENTRALTEAERERLLLWVAQGGLRGDPLDEPPPGPPRPVVTYDLTLPMPVPYTPDGTLSDDYRCFVIPWPETARTYATGFRVLPDRGELVHHVIAYAANPADVGEYEALDANEPGPGYTCFGGPGGSSPRWIGAWAPGDLGGEFPADTGIRLDPGSVIVMQVHYNTDHAAPAPDLSVMELKLAASVPKPAAVALAPATDFFIPAGDDFVEYELSAPAALVVDTELRAEIGIGPSAPFSLRGIGLHMHQLGIATSGRVAHAAGGEACLLDIPRWDFHWQGAYTLVSPVEVFPFDMMTIRCEWDNSAANQPWVGGVQQTPQDVVWGEGSRDEMCLGVIYVSAP